MRTAREAVGPDVELMVDAGGSEQFWPHGYKWALETAKMLADYDIVWFEEALPPDDIEGFIKLTRARAGPDRDRRGADPPAERSCPGSSGGAVDIIQPDCTKCGGLSESRRIAWMAYDHNVPFVPHGWNTAVGLAADLHLVGGAAGRPLRRVPDALALHRGDRRRRRSRWTPTACCRSRPRPASAWTWTGTASATSRWPV